MDSQNEGPPTTAGALNWIQSFNLVNTTVAADPNYSMVPGSSVGTPQITIINPRNMKVESLQEGWGGDYPSILIQIAQQNKQP